MYYQFRGLLIFRIKEFHDKYGPIVRTGPDELAFTSPEAWKDIYGRPGHTQLKRDPYIYPPDNVTEFPNSIIHADDVNHARIRRQMAHAFSAKALEEQQPLITKHIDTLIRQLHTAKGPQNMSDWFNFAGFDIIGDLAFGESFGCLEKGEYHPWAKVVLGAFVAGIFMSAFNRYNVLRLASSIIPKRMMKQREEFIEYCRAQVNKRFDTETDRPDFVTYMMKTNKDDQTMTKPEIQTNCTVVVVAGSESTGTLLAGTLSYLLKDSARLSKAVEEVRSTFADEGDISIKTVSKLSYTLACLEEGLRICAPAPFGMARRTSEPTIVAGELVPANTSVSVPQWAAWHAKQNFSRPDEFIPERWLDDMEFANDTKKGFYPFSTGVRNCIGKKYVNTKLFSLVPGCHILTCILALLTWKCVSSFRACFGTSTLRWQILNSHGRSRGLSLCGRSCH